MAPTKAKFADGEKLLCYHGPLLYEAKCVKSKKDGSNFLYYVHYQGWNKNWDEWVGETRILKINSENLDKKDKLLNSHLSSVKETKKKDKTRQSSSGGSAPGTPVPGERGNISGGSALTPVELKSVTKKLQGKTSTSNKGDGGTDSGNTSRASTPVSDRSVKVSQKRTSSSISGTTITKHEQDDDQRSTSSREDETPFNSGGEPSPNLMTLAHHTEKGTTASLMNERRGRLSAKKTRLSSTTSTTSTASNAYLKDLNDGIQGPGSKEMLGILNEEDSGSEAGGDGDYFGRTSSAKFDISIPEELKYVLVSDWDLLTHKKSLFSLPAKITVANILTDYIKNADKLASDGKNSMTQIRLSMIKEVAHGIKGFFDAFIGTQLLYNNERVQFHDEILKDTSGKAPSDIYGSAHLLRLMVRIGGLLDRYNIREESDVRLIEGIISDFLQYLEVNRTKYFTSKNYVEATDEYLAKAFSGSIDPVNQ